MSAVKAFYQPAEERLFAVCRASAAIVSQSLNRLENFQFHNRRVVVFDNHPLVFGADYQFVVFVGRCGVSL
jgi:hypothetical protein